MNRDEKINILIVDDIAENLFALEAIIDQDDYQLIKAHSGEEALKYLLKYDFAAILLDVQMPGMDGFRTAQIIKARQKTKNIPILFITANHFDSEHIFTGYSLGAIDYILKPFDPFILKAKVDGFVDIYKMKQKLIQQANALAEKNKVIEYMAYHDGLTELPNRRRFNEQMNICLNKAKQNNQPFTIMYLDMDRFKNINDSLGHIIGDKVLQEVAKRLIDTVREDDFVSRTGGDEFNIILPETNREQALEVAEKIFKEINQPFYIDNYELFITISIGISVFPYDGEESLVLMKNADAALYRAKEQGRNTYKVFHSGMNIQSFRSFVLQNDLRKAIEREELEVVYQPRIDLQAGSITSAEATLRWKHRDWGTIDSAEFIPLAEEIGAMVTIDQWILKTICNQLKAWQNAGHSPIRIALRFSVQQFLQKDMIANINQMLDESGISPSMLEIEIPEKVITNNEVVLEQNIYQLKEMGISVSISNFGEGYTPLHYLKRFPIDKLKINNSFIEDISKSLSDSSPLIASVLTFVRSLDLSVMVDGVETETQLNILKEFNCQEIQGYLFSAPVLPEEFERVWLKSKHETLPCKEEIVSYLKSEKIMPISTLKTKSLNVDTENEQNEEILNAALNSIKKVYSISLREMDVFTLIVRGLSNKKISEQLFISEHTVKNHITSILQKLNVNDRLQAMAIVYQACLEEGKNLNGHRKKSI